MHQHCLLALKTYKGTNLPFLLTLVFDYYNWLNNKLY